MSYDMRKWAANDLKARRRRPWTRWTLAGAVAITLGFAIAQTIDPSIGAVPRPLFVWLPLLAMAWSPFARESWLTERGMAIYDEFERAALARATARAYATFLASVILLALWGWTSARAGEPLSTAAAPWLGWALTLLAVGMALPVMFAEFMVPLPPPGDEFAD